MKLENQAAIVTGAGQGIGKSISLALAREGAAVLLCGRHQETLAGVAQEIKQLGGHAIVSVTDVSDEAAVKQMVDLAVAQFGRLNLLINNAGIVGPTAQVTNVSRDDWDEVMAVNLTGPFLCARAVIPHLVEQRSGKIVNISSIAGKMGYALRSPYSASKWGLIGLTRTLALELGPYNIQVNAICPGPVSGPRMQAVIANRAKELGQSEEEVERTYVQGTALKRMVDPEHVAATVIYLCSAEGNSMTGEALDVSAGYAL
ncbi:MAG TPA: SDR family NAD(P)-dependent oxidoreductase [Pyrinomonadaceae bacterium]|nr:SDR family NAD(P)-dependent oxidoreductase [Pyrinomonadaceae bacterium]